MNNIQKTTEHYNRVREFMRGVGQPTPDSYKEPTLEKRILRARLVLEETVEFITKGLGIEVMIPGGILDVRATKNGSYSYSKEYDSVEMIDGVCDIHVTSTGALIDAGLPDDVFQRAVDENNLEKVRNGHRNPETGKWEKHSEHKAPDILGLLRDVMEAQESNSI